MIMKKNYLIYALWMAVFLSSNVISAQNYFGDFPVKADPKTCLLYTSDAADEE